jgi:RNA-directed DNA polymerase
MWSAIFDHVYHDWLRKFLRHRVNDGGLLRLIDTWLKAGVMQNGLVTLSEDGVPQGGPVSPVLANVYLHYVLDLWFERRFKKSCPRWTELTRYADDFVAAFRDREDAERFRQEVEERPAAFELHVAPEKTAVLCFDGSLLHGTGRRRSNRRPLPSLVSSTF